MRMQSISAVIDRWIGIGVVVWVLSLLFAFWVEQGANHQSHPTVLMADSSVTSHQTGVRS